MNDSRTVRVLDALIQAEDETAKKSRASHEIEIHLTECLKLFCEAQGLPHRSADELIFEDLTKKQREWVQGFYNLWEANDPYASS